MHEGRRISNFISRTVSGPMWHGPSLSEALAGVTAGDAMSRPIDGAHTIWELVLHMAAWAEIVRRRLGDAPTPDPTADEDWPPVTNESKAAWQDALARLFTGYRLLSEDVASLDRDVLGRLVPGREYSVREMVHGVIEHGTYHGGQVVLLRRALTHVAANRVTGEVDGSIA
jgi:uncharacterized damage-inducible protein DinB